MKNFGYLPDQIKDTDYVLGGQTPIEGAILSPTGQWLNRISGGEAQRRFGVETMSCVSFGTLNIVEILIKELFSVVADYSDRYLSSMAETTPQGNSPTKVFDTLRKEAGCIDEQDLPFSESVKSFSDYIVPLFQMPKDLIRKGEEWRSKYSLKYERVFNGGTLKEKQAQLMEGLKRSPLGVSVAAWYQNEKGLYFKPEGAQDNHFTLLVGYVEGEKWLCYDSYPESEGDFIKELSWDYDFGCAFVFYLRNIEKELKWYEELINILAQIVGLQAVFVNQIAEKKTIDMPEIKEKYKWDNPKDACHSFRVICDEVGLSVNEKNMLAKVLNCESGFNVKAIHKNSDARKTTDYGICQYNDFYYADQITPDESLNNPEMACRLFIDEYRAGRLKNWVCYKTGKYQNFSSKVV